MEVATAAQPVRRPSYHGSGGTLFGIQLVNLLLTIVTLGIYSFWGKTRVRSYLWRQTEFEGDRLAYHGTGKELLIGWLKAFAIFFVLFGGIAFVEYLIKVPLTAIPIFVYLVAYAVTLILIPVAIVGSRKYRLSRTSWRGVRFSFRGRTKEFLKLFVGGSLLSVVTLGLYYPFFSNNMWRYLVSRSYFGSQRFEFDGNGADLFGRFIKAFLLSIVTFGISWIWYGATRQRYYWAHTSFAGARFRSTVMGGPLFRLILGDVLLLIITLGLAASWVRTRNIHFICSNLALEGQVDLEAIRQEAQMAPATGDELADFLGIDYPGLVPSP